MNRKNRKTASKGFTLIELLVVILILAILASLIVPQVMGHTDKAKVASAQTDLRTLSDALDTYRLEVGSYPTTDEGLQALRAAPSGASGWHGPYLKKDVPADPWGNEYHYESNGDGSYTLMSYGADGAPGGDGYAADLDQSG